MKLHDKAKLIKLVILDVDGVLTDGSFGYTSNPDEEIKFFNAKDGHAMKMLIRSGVMLGIISGRGSAANRKRFDELGLTFFYEKQTDKLCCFEKVLAKYDLSMENCLYMGDDVIDIPLVTRCGIGVAVSDAVPELIEVADLVSEIAGGKGAVRETLVWLMKAQGTWDDLMLRYYR
jgi:3-deoxy-D-manno-octulosonate 8-phosphate phosphatase (KDO 8-P phosphatase)